MSKKLIAFYSRGDKNYVCSVLKNLDIGNKSDRNEKNYTNGRT